MALALSGPGSASAVQIGMTPGGVEPVPDASQRAVQVVAAPGENNDMTIRASDPAPVLDPGAATVTYWPSTVLVTDQNATFDAAPPTGDVPCTVVDAHTARCSAPADTNIIQAIVQLGDGNNHLQFPADTIPLREEFTSGNGNDNISTGPFVGDASYRWASDTGGGNDTVRIGLPVGELLSGVGYSFGPLDGEPPPGLALRSEAGNDTVYAVNGAFDEVNCGDGNDTLYADAWDSESLYIEPSGSCEQRIPPGGG